MRLPGLSRADRRLLPEGRAAGPMPWVIAIMMFLMTLAAAGGMALSQGARGLSAQIADRMTIQIVEPNAQRREAQARAVLAELDRLTGVQSHRRVDEREMRELLEPWIGQSGLGGEIPIPVLIDVDLRHGGGPQGDAIAASIRRIAPSARIDDHGQWLAPLTGLIGSLQWLSASVVLLMAIATGFTVVLAARTALNTHRPTIDVMHLLGATDGQIARLFQRRIALDALFGGALGLAVASVVILALGRKILSVGSELIGAVALPTFGWTVLVALPIAGALLATVTARLTVLSALRKIL